MSEHEETYHITPKGVVAVNLRPELPLDAPNADAIHRKVVAMIEAAAEAQRRTDAEIAEKIANENRNIGEDAASGWDAFRLGARQVAAAILAGAAADPDAERPEGLCPDPRCGKPLATDDEKPHTDECDANPDNDPKCWCFGKCWITSNPHAHDGLVERRKS